MIDHSELQNLIKELYVIVDKLENMFPGRHFTPDGHMIGSIGECLVADAYGLELVTASNKGYDAVTKSDKKVEIKATQSDSVAFRSEPEHTIIIKIFSDGSFQEIYNGSGSTVWSQFKDKPMPSNGQYQISLKKLEMLNRQIPDTQRLPRTTKK